MGQPCNWHLLGEWTSWHDDGLVDECALLPLHGGSARAKKQKFPVNESERQT